MNKTTKLTKQNQQKQDKTNQDKKAKNADIEPLKDNSKQKEKTKPQIKKEMEIVKDKIIKLSNQLAQLQSQLK